MPFAGIQPGVSPLTQFIERLKGPQSLGMTIGGGDHNFNSIGDFLMGELNRALNAPGAEVFPAVGPMALGTVGMGPSMSALAKALQFIRSTGKTGITAATPKLGSILERAVIESRPGAGSYKSRIPGWIDLATGKLKTVAMGGEHPAEATLPGMVRTHEFPEYSTFEEFSGMKSTDIPKLIETLQGLGKPVVVPDFPQLGKYAGGLF